MRSLVFADDVSRASVLVEPKDRTVDLLTNRGTENDNLDRETILKDDGCGGVSERIMNVGSISMPVAATTMVNSATSS